MEGEQFSLCWNNFHSNLSAGFNGLLKEEQLVDVTLAADGRFLKAHRAVLSVCSPFFREIFRTGGCSVPGAHPVIILPGVSFSALRSLLLFMYRGEVSVSQEEIPAFMKAAETLRVKGLTDNASSSNNATATAVEEDSLNGIFEQRQGVKRSRPLVKKVVRPVQSARPFDCPGLSKTPSPKKAHIETADDTKAAASKPLESPKLRSPLCPRVEESFIRPKHEPAEDGDDDDNDGDDIDIANMLDTTLSEPSPSPSQSQSQFASWTPTEGPLQDETTPDLPPRFMRSGRGQMVLIHGGHLYTASGGPFSSGVPGCSFGVQLWRCVKEKLLGCEGFVATRDGSLLPPKGRHNHDPLQDVISRLQISSRREPP